MTEEQFRIIEDAAERLASRQHYEERNRLALLSIHGIVGVLVGVILLMDGLPFIWAHVLSTPWQQKVFAASALAGGVILMAGLAMGRQLMVEAVGMTLLLLWDLATAIIVYISTHQPDSIPAGTHASLYPVFVYGGLGALMSVHLVTLVTFLGRGVRRGNQ